MPEGHSIHRLARAFAELFGGQTLQASSPQGRFEAGAAQVNGMRLTQTQAHGKHLFLGFEPPNAPPRLRRATATVKPTKIDHWVRIHLGIYGSWVFDGDDSFTSTHSIGAPRRRVGEQERAVAPSRGATRSRAHVGEQLSTTRLRLVGEHGLAELTGPTACELINDAERLEVIARLGPDPLIPDPDSSQRERFVAKAGARRTAIGLQLMEQQIIAGVGNIYRAETLFQVGVDPHTPGTAVGVEALTQMWDYLVLTMSDGVRTGRIVTAQGVRLSVAKTQALPSSEAYFVYQRTGLPCRCCGTPIREEIAAARKLYWCPGCQR